MKKIILSCLFFALTLAGAEQSLATISKQATSISTLSDADLEHLWKELQTLLAESKSKDLQEKSKIIVNKIIKEKLKRSLNNKESQEAISKIFLEVLLAISFEGTALILSGESVEYALYASAIRQLSSSMASYMTSRTGALINTAASSTTQAFTSWILQLPSAGQGLALFDPISLIPFGSSGTKAVLNKLGYTQKTISTFNQVQQSVAQFFQSLSN